jgi:phage terminase large subunit
MMKIRASKVFNHCESSYRKNTSIIICQGGARAGKTYNILIWLISHSLTDWNNEIIDIGRKSFPSLRASVMFDFLQILKENNLYSEKYHDKSNHIYRINTNIFRFFSVDQETKIRGSKRSFLFLNEANEFKYEDFKQLNMRTTKMTIIDFNPSDEFHWIYDDVIKRDDADFYKTTFIDNPFLDERIKKEILSFKEKDSNYWRIYGLGERGVSESSIFTHWNICDKYEGEGQEFFGLDFGYNDPTCLVRTKYHKEGIVSDLLFYKTNLTSDLIVLELQRLVEEKKLNINSVIYADSARPEIIQEIKNAGFNIHSVKKEAGSILRGINFIKKHKLLITQDSVELIKELRNYKWRVDKDGKTLDAPVDLFDHSIDALRYSLDSVSSSKVFIEPSMGRAVLFK